MERCQGRNLSQGPGGETLEERCLLGLSSRAFSVCFFILYSASYHMLTLLPPPWAGPSHIIDQENGPTVLPTGSVMEACSQGFLFPGD